ncbi:hypothetical protein [Luteimonas kalidii]|uniref:Uncharacterized protein n=1 Tax=Luteimonas kalidii TaxID=3042025 RepID=A0ABT6JU77_9GAMM|nr:hypothetical protein [Luteimonas kalidii]MDH5834245.1 hypothetical protein [Luteimonas kalidii]
MTAKRSLREVLADAFSLIKTDRDHLERCMRAGRVAGLDLSPSSVRKSSDDDVRQWFDGGKIARS